MERSCKAGRPGIVAGRICQYITSSMAEIREHPRESIATSCTVVIGPSSGTLIFRLRFKLCSFMRCRRSFASEGFSALSGVWPTVNETGSSWSSGFTAVTRGEAAGCLSLGNSWYFRASGCAILQICGFLSSDELVDTSCMENEKCKREKDEVKSRTRERAHVPNQ